MNYNPTHRTSIWQRPAACIVGVVVYTGAEREFLSKLIIKPVHLPEWAFRPLSTIYIFALVNTSGKHFNHVDFKAVFQYHLFLALFFAEQLKKSTWSTSTSHVFHNLASRRMCGIVTSWQIGTFSSIPAGVPTPCETHWEGSMKWIYAHTFCDALHT